MLYPLTARADPQIQTPGMSVGWGLALGALVTGVIFALIYRNIRSRLERKVTHSLQQVTSLIEHADCILWEARVELDTWKWVMTFHPTSLARRIFGESTATEKMRIWYDMQKSEREILDHRTRETLRQGRSAYEQVIHGNLNGRSVWLQEKVSVTLTGKNEFWLVGLVTDVTAQHLAEEARIHSETRLTQMLERTDSLIWQSQVVRSPQGELIWAATFVPPARLYRKIFNKDPDPPGWFYWREIGVPEEEEMALRWMKAVAGGASGYRQVFHVPKAEGDIWLSEHVSIKPAGPDKWDLVGIITDISARREAEAAQQKTEGRLRELLSHANCLLWEATVELIADGWKWEFSVQDSGLSQKLFNAAQPPPQVGLWGGFKIPEWQEMNQRARAALTSGSPGYGQIFQIVKEDGSVIWIQESVTIRPLGQNRFTLVGLATDITAQRTAEIARRAGEEQLRQLMGHANCMLWQADVTRDESGKYDWAWFVPASELFRRIVGEDQNIKPYMPWANLNVPEFAQMEENSHYAMNHHLPGYEQEFRVRVGTEILWIHEQVTIAHLTDNHWKLEGVCIDITANRRAVEAQLASNAQLEQLLNVANCMVWDAEVGVLPDGSLTWSHFMPRSALYRRIFGDTPETRLLWHTKNVPELEEMNARVRAAVKAQAPGYVNDFHVILPDGVIWLREDVTIKREPSGQLRMVGVVTDVSARRTAEEAMRVSEQRYRTLFQHPPVAIIEADFTQVGTWLDDLRRNGVENFPAWLDADATRVRQGAALVQITNINRTALTLLRATSLDAFRRRRHLLETPDALGVIRSAFVALWEGRTELEAELQMHDVAGGERHMNMRWWIGRNESTVDLTQTVMVFIDLTELKKTEAELAEEKERLAVTLRAMTEGVITTDLAGRILFINPAAATLTQVEAASATGRLLTEVCVFQNNRDGTAVEVPISRVAQGDTVVNLPERTRLATPSGSYRLVEGCCAPIHSAASAVIGTVLVFRDVTEHERLEEELVRATRLESVGVLAGGIAHDFNNILTAVMGNIALALLDVPADSPTGVSLRAAEKATIRARDLTQQLLTFAKGGEPVRAAVQLDAIVREMTTFSLHGSQVKAVYDFPPNLWPADADKGQIGRVIQNLAINSVQAMPGGGTLFVKAGNDRVRGLAHPGLDPGDYVLITITDTGEGISLENLSRIFDPYFTTKKTGSGLGLAAVYSIIKKHRGHVEVESQVGRGTTFRIWLPALHEKAQPTTTRPPMASSTMNGRVLFMDDDEIIRVMATKLLQRFGLEVECTADGAIVVEKYRAARDEGRPFSLVVMDLTVPGGMGGLPALAKLKELDPQVRAIVSSGYSSDPVLANYREHGFCAVISKPYDIHEFFRVLREALPSPPQGQDSSGGEIISASR